MSVDVIKAVSEMEISDLGSIGVIIDGLLESGYSSKDCLGILTHIVNMSELKYCKFI